MIRADHRASPWPGTARRTSPPQEPAERCGRFRLVPVRPAHDSRPAASAVGALFDGGESSTVERRLPAPAVPPSSVPFPRPGPGATTCCVHQLRGLEFLTHNSTRSEPADAERSAQPLSLALPSHRAEQHRSFVAGPRTQPSASLGSSCPGACAPTTEPPLPRAASGGLWELSVKVVRSGRVCLSGRRRASRGGIARLERAPPDAVAGHSQSARRRSLRQRDGSAHITQQLLQ